MFRKLSVAVLLCLLVAAFVDDKPDANVVQLQQYFSAPQSSKAYAVLVAMGELPLPQGPLFCALRDNQCVATLFHGAVDSQALMQQHAALLEHLAQFYRVADYKTLSTPGIAERLPSFKHLGAAARLQLLQALAVYKSGDSERALQYLQQQFEAQRVALAQQDNLIGKMVLVSRLADIVDTASLIQSTSAAVHISAFAQLDASERNLAPALAREFATIADTYRAIARKPQDFDLGNGLPAWALRPVYKPGVTINASAAWFMQQTEMTRLAAPQFAAVLQQTAQTPPAASPLRNLIGNTFVQESADYMRYSARLLDLQAKLVLFAAAYTLPPAATTSTDASARAMLADNPYYPGQTPENKEGLLCFNGPLPDKRHLRCLRMQLP